MSEDGSHPHRGKKTPTLRVHAVRLKHEVHVSMTVRPKRTKDVVKRPVLRSRRTEPKTPWGIPAAKAARANRKHTRCGHTQFRLGGRNRSDASRVFHTGRSQDLLVSRRALARKKFVAPPDAGRGWTEGETVRVREISKQVVSRTACGFIACRFSIRWKAFSGPARLALTGKPKQSPLARRSTPRQCRKTPTLVSTSGGLDSDSGVPAGDDGNVRGRHVLVKALQGPRRSAESSHPRRSKRRRSSGAPNRERPKLTTANSFVDPPPP